MCPRVESRSLIKYSELFLLDLVPLVLSGGRIRKLRCHCRYTVPLVFWVKKTGRSSHSCFAHNVLEANANETLCHWKNTIPPKGVYTSSSWSYAHVIPSGLPFALGSSLVLRSSSERVTMYPLSTVSESLGQIDLEFLGTQRSALASCAFLFSPARQRSHRSVFTVVKA